MPGAKKESPSGISARGRFFENTEEMKRTLQMQHLHFNTTTEKVNTVSTFRQNLFFQKENPPFGIAAGGWVPERAIYENKQNSISH